MAQENEFSEVIRLIGEFVDAARASLMLPPRIDAVGQAPFPEDELAKLVLAQQYDGRCNRVSIGLLSLLKEHLGIKTRWQPSYKTLERAYEDADVIALLNEVFFLTQQPVKDLEHEFAMDGTCNPNTIKANWESSKDKILKLAGKQHAASSAKERKKRQFEKVIIAAGTTFKIISAFAITKSSTANESPYLKPLLGQILEFYS